MISSDGVISGLGISGLRSARSYDKDEWSDAFALNTSGAVDRTQQEFKDECDINVILKRFGLTGELPEHYRPPLEGDFVDAVTDYQTALNAVRTAQERFMEMPAELRARFQNDPQRLISFLGDDRNRKEAEDLGLLERKEQPPAPPAPAPAPPVPPVAG